MGRLMATKFSEAGLTPTLVTRKRAEPARSQLELQRHHAGETKSFTLSIEPTNLNAPIQQLLVTTKSNQVLQALADIKPRIRPQTKIVLLHNGMGVLEALQKDFGADQLYPGVTTEGAYQQTTDNVSDPQLVYAGQGITQIGQLGQPKAPEWIQPLLDRPLGYSWHSNIEQALWRKLLVNCAINPLTAIHNRRNGDLLSNPKLRSELDQVLQELAQVARAVGQAELADNLTELVHQVIEGTKDNFASMQQDIQHHRATEIGQINGYLCAQAAVNGIPTPINQTLIEAVSRLEAAYQPQC